MKISTVFLLTVLFASFSRAVVPGWIDTIHAYGCWDKLGSRSNPNPEDEPLYKYNGTVVESPLDPETLAIVHSRWGSTKVMKNGACDRSSETAEQWTAKQLEKRSCQVLSYKKDTQGSYTLSEKSESGTETRHSLPEKDYMELKKAMIQLLTECAKSDGVIGTQATSSLKALGAGQSPPGAASNPTSSK